MLNFQRYSEGFRLFESVEENYIVNDVCKVMYVRMCGKLFCNKFYKYKYL